MWWNQVITDITNGNLLLVCGSLFVTGIGMGCLLWECIKMAIEEQKEKEIKKEKERQILENIYEQLKNNRKF